MLWFSNRGGPGRGAWRPGVHGLSNHLLDTPWPKVERGKRALSSSSRPPRALEPGPLLEILLDRTRAADHDLPDTGVPRERERALSASFIATPDYGTRASTALLCDRDGRGIFVERTFSPDGGCSVVRHPVPAAGRPPANLDP